MNEYMVTLTLIEGKCSLTSIGYQCKSTSLGRRSIEQIVLPAMYSLLNGIDDCYRYSVPYIMPRKPFMLINVLMCYYVIYITSIKHIQWFIEFAHFPD